MGNAINPQLEHQLRLVKGAGGETQQTHQMEQDDHTQQDEFIRERLHSNLEAYTNNAVLNKLTPNKANPKPPSISSSLKRSATSNSASKKSTPGWNKRYPKRNDSNIVTSPVKTIRQFGHGDESSDEYDTTTTYDDYKGGKGNRNQSESQRESNTLKVPIKSSPKKPLRKGTPKVPKTRDLSISKSPKKVSEPAAESPSSSKSRERSRYHDHSREEQSNSATAAAAATFNSSSRRLVTNSHINHDISNQNNAEDDDDDDDLIGVHHNSNNTLLSEIPSDILSPEKHIYPPENLRRSSSTVPSRTTATKISESTNSLSKSFPTFTPPSSKTPHNERTRSQENRTLKNSPASRQGRHERSTAKEKDEVSKPETTTSNRGKSLPPSLYPAMTKTVEEYEDEEDGNHPSQRNLASDITNTRFIEEERQNISLRKKKESEAISIFFDRSSSSKKVEESEVTSNVQRLEPLDPKKTEKISPRTLPNIFKDQVPNPIFDSSFKQLNEFIKNPIIDENKYKPNSQLLEKPASNTSNIDNKPTTASITSDRRSSRLLDLSQFESSDEEPVPELTVPLPPPNDEKPRHESPPRKRKSYDEPIETSTINKRSKPSLYPIIPSQTPIKRSEPTNQHKQLYPTLAPMGNNTIISADMIENISDHIPNVESISESKPVIREERQRPPSKQLQQQPEQEQEQLGDAEHWVKEQWKCFFRAFKKYKRTNDLSMFNERLLNYLRCDEHEIKLKIQFALDFEDDIRKR